MTETTTSRARAEAWFHNVNTRVRGLAAKIPTREATEIIANARDEAERRVDFAVQRVLSTFQIVTTTEVAELDAKLKTIAKRIEQIEKKYAKRAATA